MTFLQRLIRAVMAAFLALIVLAATLASVSVVGAALSEGAVLGVGDSFTVVFGFTLLLGAIPAICLGAPIYAWLWQKGRASWTTSTLLGVTLGIPFFFIADELGVWAAAAGAAVAITTHAICRAGANNSFKPSPHQGGA